MTIKEKSDKYLVKSYARADVVFVRGDGSLLYDENGKEYIDFGSGIAVNGFGIGDKEWIEEVYGQLKKISHVSNLYYSEPQAELAEKLCVKSGMKKAFFSNSGAEANECAIKCARKYSFDKYGGNRNKIITFDMSFHGRTMETLSATAQDNLHNYFFPFSEGFKYSDKNIESFLKTVDGNIAAVMTEFIQGEGGVVPMDKHFIKEVYEYCIQNDILFIADEVQTGNGRTGRMFAFEHYGIKPDIVTTAKGLGNGLPIGATLFGEKTAEVFTPGTHGSTFGGNPAICKGSSLIIDKINDELLNDVLKKEEIIREELSKVNGITLSGMGLMIGITCKNNKQIIEKCKEKGLIVLAAKDKIRLLPPLNISNSLLLRGLNILKEVLSSEV